jgi:tetratricopeptide (TPR) repeat protein
MSRRATAASIVIALVAAMPGGAHSAPDARQLYRECYEGDLPDRVIAACSAVIRDHIGDRLDIASAFRSRGDAYDDKGEYDLALADYAEALALNPGDAEVFNSRGATRTALEQYGSAIEDFDRSVTLSPGRAIPLSNRCFAKAVLGRLEEALTDCNEAIRLHPGRVATFSTRGFVYLKLGRSDEAIADYNVVLNKRADEPYALFGRAAARRMKGDLRGSDGDAVRAVTVKPDIAEYMARIGVRLGEASQRGR